MKKHLRLWMGPFGMTFDIMSVWWNLDRPKFLTWYMTSLLRLGYAALLGLLGVAIWAKAAGASRPLHDSSS